MTLIQDVKDAFKAKGLDFVSLGESSQDREKTTLTYVDSSGKTVHKELGIRLGELEDTIAALDGMDPEDLANFLLE